MSSETTPLTVASVLCEVAIDAPRVRVWEALVGEIAAWWHPAYYTDPRGAEIGGFHLEARVGGRVYEDWGDGQGLLWGTVVGIDTGDFLQVVGDSSPEWGGPARSFQTWRLEEEGERTRLRFENTVFGRVTEETRASLEAGWRFLLEECFKRFCETGSIEGAPAAPEC